LIENKFVNRKLEKKGRGGVSPCHERLCSKPEKGHTWIQRFDRFRSASGLEGKSGVTQVNSLIYSMGPEADDIFASFELNDENKKKYAKVKEKFDNHFIVRRNVIFERAKFNKRKQEDSENTL
jgi:hypothetical protein